jgi:hypothetical protein
MLQSYVNVMQNEKGSVVSQVILTYSLAESTLSANGAQVQAVAVFTKSYVPGESL